jgi:MYXO-CTERM domain-containing protein
MIIRFLLLGAALALLAQCHAPAPTPAPLGFVAIAQPAGTPDSTDPVTPEPPPVAPSPPPAVPGPLPLLGLGAAWTWARRLRRRIKAAQPTATKPQ